MIEVAFYALWAAVILTALAFVGYLVLLTGRRTAAERKPRKVPVGAGAAVDDDALAEFDDSTPSRTTASRSANTHSVAWVATTLSRLALAAMTISLIARMVAVGHAPFSNQHEFACSFAWGILLAYVYFEWRYRLRTLSLVAIPVALGMLLYAALGTNHAIDPLMPALQNHFLLTLHVVSAVLGYGAAAVSFAAAVLYLVKPKVRWRSMPSGDLLDEIGYKGVVFAFPLMTLMLILGALWADIAWGKYWSWDPKETAALVTWLIYGAYLHARVTHGWQGNRSAWLLILGFMAVLFTYFGNLFFGGLHAYA